jgi:hypothetical protein
MIFFEKVLTIALYTDRIELVDFHLGLDRDSIWKIFAEFFNFAKIYE